MNTKLNGPPVNFDAMEKPAACSCSRSSTGSSPATLDLPDVGMGRQRTSGTYIALLLQLEGDKDLMAEILVDVCELLDIELEKLPKLRDWHKAGGDPDGDNPAPSFH